MLGQKLMFKEQNGNLCKFVGNVNFEKLKGTIMIAYFMVK